MSGKVAEVLRTLDDELMVDLWPTAGRVLNKKRSSIYRAAREGSIPAVRIGGNWRVSSSWLRQVTGLPPVTMPLAEAA